MLYWGSIAFFGAYYKEGAKLEGLATFFERTSR